MAVLRTSHVFGALELVVLNDLAEALEIETVEGGNLILREGDVAESMLIVVSGRLRVSRKNPDGSLRLYNEVSPGEMVGEAGIILEQRRFADVTALRDSTIAILHRGRFEYLLMRHPVALNRVFAQAATRLTLSANGLAFIRAGSGGRRWAGPGLGWLRKGITGRCQLS